MKVLEAQLEKEIKMNQGLGKIQYKNKNSKKLLENSDLAPSLFDNEYY